MGKKNKEQQKLPGINNRNQSLCTYPTKYSIKELRIVNPYKIDKEKV